ncbi:carbohydrate ABC transporter permease [Desmospora activa]|uniref:Carbohydrate ABC transporter membrane protein 1 (CUT1 family) n=1 Tax=Desmospora activa DSM 45169 TaxID=1121389 RepID=A0A2T4Z424_9BACL|nr:sugar ABC transporter permease [Desmospora activa]PTM56653.1 carbohydrate ABC transporter membrane protein 1 (CUT1 family) [Desmospora activa DSM 45169]
MHHKYRKWWAYAFIAPTMITLLMFWLIPLGFALILSLMHWDGFGEKTFVGLDNFIYLFQDPVFQRAVVNTVYYTVLTIPTNIIIALLLALALNKIPGKDVYRVFYFMPVVTSAVSVGVIWIWILNGDFGILNSVLSTVGIAGPNWLADDRWVIPAIAIVGVWWGLGFNVVIFLAGLQGISRSYYEAAEMDGATTMQKFFHITLPLLSPTTFFVAVMAVISSFQVFDQVFVMTQGGPGKASHVVVLHMYEMAFQKGQFGVSTATAVVLFMSILLFTIIQFKLSKRWVHYEG